MEIKKLFRKRILVVRAAQYTYGLAFAMFSVALSAGIVVASVMVFYSPSAIPCPDGTEGCTAIVIAPTNLGSLLLSLAALTIPATLLSFLLGVIISHRTFGPLVRIRAFIAQLIAGDYSARLKMRDKDHLGELAEIFNQLAETLEAKHPGDKPKDN